jgi:RNA recognition motif-containing protein
MDVPMRAPIAPPVATRATRLYVGNLAYDTSDVQLRDLFAQHGEVVEVFLVMDRDSGRPRGFGFVTMATPEGAGKAIRELHGQTVEGRPLVVNEAEERQRTGGGGPRRNR